MITKNKAYNIRGIWIMIGGATAQFWNSCCAFTAGLHGLGWIFFWCTLVMVVGIVVVGARLGKEVKINK